MDTIVIGKILKPQGIKGQVKIQPITQDINRFKKLKSVYVDGQTLTVNSAVIRDQFVYLDFCDMLDRNMVEGLRNKFISVSKEEAIKLPKNCWFISDLVGCDVFDNDEKHIGKLTEVLQNGSADVYVIDNGKAMFPALNKLLLNVDIDSKKIVVDKDVLKGVCVYED